MQPLNFVNVSYTQLISANVHLGFPRKHWNPKMIPFLIGERNKMHILDLEQSVYLLRKALSFVVEIIAKRGTLLFVSENALIDYAIGKIARKCKQPYTAVRWIGGTLTNLPIVYEAIRLAHGKRNIRSKRHLYNILKGLKGIGIHPAGIFILNVSKSKWALNEALNVGIPAIGICDSNSNPFGLSYPIIGNTVGLPSLLLFSHLIKNAVIMGKVQQRMRFKLIRKLKRMRNIYKVVFRIFPRGTPEKSSVQKVLVS